MAYFDVESLNQMFKGDEDIFVEIRNDFVESYGEMLTAIKNSVDNASAPELQISAHTLKGVLATFCAQDLKAMAFELEEMGKNGELEKSKEKFEKLCEQMPLFIEELRDFDTKDMME